LGKTSCGEPLILWVVYDHPQDYPDSYVARKFVLDQPTEEHIVSPRLEMLRKLMMDWGLSCLPRNPEVEPQIVETWWL